MKRKIYQALLEWDRPTPMLAVELLKIHVSHIRSKAFGFRLHFGTEMEK